jgi:hypothetical protein
MRAQLPTLELDAVFEAKEELALAVKQALAETMTVRQRPTTGCTFCVASNHGSCLSPHDMYVSVTLRVCYVHYFSGLWVSDSSNFDYRS